MFKDIFKKSGVIVASASILTGYTGAIVRTMELGYYTARDPWILTCAAAFLGGCWLLKKATDSTDNVQYVADRSTPPSTSESVAGAQKQLENLIVTTVVVDALTQSHDN